jgi:cytoplasmic tRNA 2-thiolation protein 1
MYIYEKEIVLYAHFKKLDYFSTECTYAPNAYRGYTRNLVKHLEASNSQTILQILYSMSQLRYDASSTSATPPGFSKKETEQMK